MNKTKGGIKTKRLVRKKKPKFNVPNYGFFKSVKARWRRPRGTHNKKRIKYKFMGALPKIGYRNSEKIRGLHSSGNREVLVNNLSEMDALKDSKAAIRVAAAIGAKKRRLIEEKAKVLKLVVLNARFNGQSEGKWGKHTEKNEKGQPTQKTQKTQKTSRASLQHAEKQA